MELAIKFCERALELEPDNVYVLNTMASVLLEAGGRRSSAAQWRNDGLGARREAASSPSSELQVAATQGIAKEPAACCHHLLASTACNGGQLTLPLCRVDARVIRVQAVLSNMLA